MAASAATTGQDVAAGAQGIVRRVALVGNPNTGKTTLFNRLCGARAKTSNYPGTTTATRIGRSVLTPDLAVEVIDLPGAYQLGLETPETRIVREVLTGAGPYGAPSVVVVLVDAVNLGRNLALVGELLAYDVPVVVCLNMMDLAQRRHVIIDAAALTRRLGVAVVPAVASQGRGLDDLKRALAGALAGRVLPRPPDVPPAGAEPEALAEWSDRVLKDSAGQMGLAPAEDALTERLDRVLTHPVFGLLAFLAVMGGLFWALFALARIPMDLIEATFAGLGGLVRQYLSDGPLRSLLINGVIGGIAGTVVFVPQIALLFFLISLLEDTGYLARAAFVNDRFFQPFGLPGQAFVPLLTAHACALPGLMSTRLIPDRRDRLATILVLPFMSCSARLPVYILLTTLLFAQRPALAGVAFAGCFVLGAAAAFLTAWLFGRTILRGRARPMVLELPSYKMPSLTNALLAAKDQSLSFLKTAGTIIFAICVVMWWLSSYPRVAPPPAAVALRAQAATMAQAPDRAAALEAEAATLEGRAQQQGSYIGRFGRWIQPVFRPLGYDWQLTVGLMTSFIAREVFVSTMSVLAGGRADAPPDQGVITRIQQLTRDDGTLVFSPAAAASALVFFVLAMQCLATLTVTRREAGGLRYAAIQFVYMSGLAYASAFVVFQVMRAMGVN